jgi:hypothetical protein
MSKNKRIFISCESANHSCDKTQYNEASFWEKVKLTMHLIYCKACRKYTKNNGKLTHLINTSDVKCLDISEKDNLKEEFQQELLKNQ